MREGFGWGEAGLGEGRLVLRVGMYFGKGGCGWGCRLFEGRLSLHHVCVERDGTELMAQSHVTPLSAAKINSIWSISNLPNWPLSPNEAGSNTSILANRHETLTDRQVEHAAHGTKRQRPPRPSSRQDTPAPIRRQALPDPNLQIPHPQLPRLLGQAPIPVPHLPDTHHRRRREQQCLPRIEMHDGVEDLLEITLRARGACEVGSQGVEPLRGGESMDKRHRAKIQQLRGNGGLLRGDDDAGSEVALLADDREKGIGEDVGGGGVGHVLLWCLVSSKAGWGGEMGVVR